MTGFNSKRAAAADKLQEPVAFDSFLESQDFYELMQTYRHYQIDAHIPFEAVKDALRSVHIEAALAQQAQDGKCKLCVDGCVACDARAQPAQEPVARECNFCERCGKRTKDLTVIHTCTPPQEKNL